MGSGTIGVAISTTGDEHRMGFLETCVEAWRKALPLGSVLIVTVDGTEADCARAYKAFDRTKFGTVWRVGQRRWAVDPFDGHQGVAVNKNTGIELLMEHGVEHLFLCDDDTWPLLPQSLDKHIDLANHVPHSMVCWAAHRFEANHRDYATWTWPRGSLMYAHRSVVDVVGGMVEEFGPGGHEHVEWSRRIHQRGLTPGLYCSPRVYSEASPSGLATRASMLWHCEDMPRPGERASSLRRRREALTSVRRTPSDWPHIEKIMDQRDGDTSFVPYWAHQNSRASATLCSTSTGQGAGGDK